ncbi:hypothetical protein DB30_01771 [Enhygromyxa salina]|uniref:Chaperone protein DnaJ n=1 Tax=Enhygromyxa salina TaxID=215803 RepID=A0A0C2CRG9_9BACT|nr:hypothetical protein [Enhygromyxa salina]KIG12245.1 hypothetical protein DB30_01771 [Enhygromyxa salina]
MSDLDYYAILGVGPEAERDEIEGAYQREVVGADYERARILEEARGVLLDPASRADYDARVVGSALIEETVTAILDAHLPRAEARLRAQRKLIAAASSTRPDARTPSS